MSHDPIVRLANLRVIKASRQLELELANVKGSGPTLEILKRLKDRAAESLAALAFVDPNDAEEIRTLQNEVKRYDEWITWMQEIVSEGITTEKQMDAAEREELLDMMLATPEGQREAQELGLIDLEQRDA